MHKALALIIIHLYVIYLYNLQQHSQPLFNARENGNVHSSPSSFPIIFYFHACVSLGLAVSRQSTCSFYRFYFLPPCTHCTLPLPRRNHIIVATWNDTKKKTIGAAMISKTYSTTINITHIKIFTSPHQTSSFFSTR